MNYEVLKTQLKNKQINNLYLLFGDEQYLIDSVVKKIEHDVLGEQSNPMTKNEFRDHVDVVDILDAVNTMPMIGNKKLVICKNSGLFHVGKEVPALLDLFDNISHDAYLIFIEEKVSKKHNHYKKLKEMACVYEINMRKSYDIVTYIIKQFKRRGKKITNDNANLFLLYSGTHLLDIEKDIEKISLFMDEKIEVRKQFIMDLCQGTKEAKLYELTNATFEKNKNKAYKILKELLSDKIPVQIILTVLNSSYMELYEVKLALDNNQPAKVLRRGRPIHEYALKKLVQSARRFSISQIRQIVKKVADTDIAIKTGLINDKTAIELLLFEVTEVG